MTYLLVNSFQKQKMNPNSK